MISKPAVRRGRVAVLPQVTSYTMESRMDIAGLVVLVIVALGVLGILGARINEIHKRLGVLFRVEAKLDLLLRQANLKFDPYQAVTQEIRQAIQQGKKIEAIKLYREMSGVGLKQAKDFIEEVQRRAGL
jgi:ribosomal protein L7/L12